MIRATRPAHRLAALVLLLPALAFLSACGGHEDDAAGGAVVHAQTALATSEPFAEAIDAIGTVEVRAGHSAALSAPAPALVSRVLVAAGTHVTEGQPLVELDPTNFQAATQSAEAALTAAQQAYDRADRLAREGIVPHREVEQAAAELARARADAVAARRTERLSVLRAPIAGVVTRMTAALGAEADPGQPLVEIADPSAVDVLLRVTPAAAARIRPGAAVTLRGEGAAAIGTGAVVDVAGIVDTASRGVTVRVLPRTTGRPLRIGETVTGSITLATRPNAVVVPLAALVPEGESFRVFVVDTAGMAHARAVTVGGRDGRVAEITAGLAAGERVVTEGAYGVQDSAKIAQDRP